MRLHQVGHGGHPSCAAVTALTLGRTHPQVEQPDGAAALGGTTGSVSGAVATTSGRLSPGRPATASGVCSRTRERAVWPGTRSRVSRETRIIVANASGTDHAAGWATSAANQPPVRSVTRLSTTATPESAPADEQSGERADVGQPAPPDAQHQQGAERGGGQGEGQPDDRRDGDAAHHERQEQGYDDRHHRGDAERGHALEPLADDVLADHAGDRDGQPRRRGQERGERTAGEQRVSRSPPSPPTIREGSSSTRVSDAPAARSGA